MKRKVIITADGSSTIHLPEWDEQYHSKHGAIQEAYHVFLKMGLFHFINEHSTKPVRILEIGFGTGLNAFITAIEAAKNKVPVLYTGVEAYPVSLMEINQLNYTNAFDETPRATKIFEEIHHSPWEKTVQIAPYFQLTKEKKFFQDIEATEAFDLIYFDAFGARVQPELWETPIFRKMYNALVPEGTLVTYSAKGSAKRAMVSVGFLVEKLPGPPGKREMLRAIKP